MALPGLFPLLLLKVSAALSTIPASCRPHHSDLIKGLCEWSSWILSSGVVDFFIVPRLYHLPFRPQQTPYLSYNKPPILAHLCSVRGSKRIRRQSPGGLCLPGSARTSSAVSSSEFCLGFYVSGSIFLRPLKCHFPDASWPPRGGPESVTLLGLLPKIKYEIPWDLRVV